MINELEQLKRDNEVLYRDNVAMSETADRLREALEQMRGILFEAPHWDHCREEEGWDEDGSPVLLCDCGLTGLLDIASAALKVKP